VIEDPARGWKYRADMLLREHALILELDGLAKYDGDALRREKVRETRLRWLGYRVVRLLWEDVVYDWPITRNRLWAVIRS
jgi:very-short-patch-repair endonuclease